ncbi:hypothetical protein HDU97_002814 [Phlyctochytrium planicorne]|nr:hypothetical protein HDU97_002814 [Phlyctochytrium planicorne]
MWKKKEIQNLSATSVVDLKAELFKTQESFEKEKLKAGSTAIRATSSKVYKKSDSNKGVAERSSKDLEESSSEHNALQASYVALQRKSKEYESLKRKAEAGEDVERELNKKRITDGKKRFGQREEEGSDSDHDAPVEPEKGVLVDFLQKSVAKKMLDGNKKKRKGRGDDDDDDEEEEKDEADPWVETVDQFGRTKIVRKSQADAMKPTETFVKASNATSTSDFDGGPTMVSADMKLQMERENWEAGARAEAEAVEPKHFEAGKEIRNLGVGFYAFSREESERERQMADLKRIREQTVKSRDKAHLAKDARKERLEERRALLKERSLKAKAKDRQPVEEATGGDGDDLDAFLKDIRKGVEGE